MTSDARSGCLMWMIGLLAFAGVGTLLLLLVLFDVFPGSGPDGQAAADPSPLASPSASPAASPSAPPPGDPDGWTVVLADEAGGLTLIHAGGPEVEHRQAAMAGAGITVDELVGGRYETPDGTEVVDFHGGRLADPLPGPELDQSGRTVLEDTFRVNFPNLTPADGQSREYDAGPLGGQLWCVTYSPSWSACGWVDQWTIGYVFARADEAETAELLVGLRADLEVPG